MEKSPANKKKVKDYPDNTYYQVTENEWVDIVWSGFKEQCCGCGLVHVTDYRVTPAGGLQFRATVDRRASAAVRRGKKKRAV